MSDEPVTGDVVADVGDEKYVKYRTRTAKQKDAIRTNVLRNIMASIDGREWMYELLEKCHVYISSFSFNALGMAFWEGERNVGLKLYGELQAHCPEQYLLMMKEAKDRDVVVN